MSKAIEYSNYQLYRTTPKLSGNMKWDLLVVPTSDDQLKVIDFHLRPISEYVPFVPMVDEDILTRPHQFNIKRFAESCKGHFYDCPADPSLTSDWPDLLAAGTEDAEFKYRKTWDDTYWAGTQRIRNKLYGQKLYDKTQYAFTHECLVPMWIEACRGLKITISKGSTKTYTLNLAEPEAITTYHDRFCKYFFDYLKYTGCYDGNQNCLEINFRNSLTSIYGLDVLSGNMILRHDYNVVRNLVYRERPLLEANSLLTNIFRDVNMILPQLINFNIIFNPAELDDAVHSLGPKQYEISTGSFISFLGITDNAVEKRDLFTNHYFIPRIQTQYLPTSGIVTKPDWLRSQNINALDYLQDFRSSEMMHANKMVQPVCHWASSGYPDMLFNVYDGFGTCFVDGAGNLLGKIDHVYGNQADPAITDFDNIAPNDNWTGRLIYGDGFTINTVLGHAPQYIGGWKHADPDSVNAPLKNCLIREDYLLSLSGYINGNKFGYVKKTNADPDDIFIGLMKSPPYNENDTTNPADMWEALGITKIIGIFSHRYEKNGTDSLTPYGKVITDSRDINYDVAEHHDIDNRFYKWVQREYGRGSGGLVKDYVYRASDNVYGLYIGMADADAIDSNGEKKHIKVFVFWAKDVFLPDRSTREGLTYVEHRSQELVLGYIMKAVHDYAEYYNKALKDDDEFWKTDENGNEPEDSLKNILDNINLLNDAIHTFKKPDVIYFDRSITPVNDISASLKATEICYVKDDVTDHYVYRYSESIKPAMFPPAIKRDDIIMYRNALGRNFLWVKDSLKTNEISNFDKNYNKYAITGIAPVYPSLNYDSVNLAAVPNQDTKTADRKTFNVENYTIVTFKGIVDSININEIDENIDIDHLESSNIYWVKSVTYVDEYKVTKIDDTKQPQFYVRIVQKDPATDEETYRYCSTKLSDTKYGTEYNPLNTKPLIYATHDTYYYLEDSCLKVFYKIKDNDTPNPHGDLIYDEPIPIFTGKNIDESTPFRPDRSIKWCEYKWFDKSKIVTFPVNNGPNGIRLIDMPTNDIEYLKNKVLEKFTETYDYDYLKLIYDITYEIQHIRIESDQDVINSNGWNDYVGTDGNVILYTYQVYMKLK